MKCYGNDIEKGVIANHPNFLRTIVSLETGRLDSGRVVYPTIGGQRTGNVLLQRTDPSAHRNDFVVKRSLLHEEIKQFLNPNAKDRRFTISEAVLIKGIDPFILRIYAQEKSDLTLYDLVVVYFFSNNQTLLDINNYLSVDFKQIASLDQFFYLVKDYSGKTYLIIAGEDAVFDPQLTVLKKQALSDISGLIAQELK